MFKKNINKVVLYILHTLMQTNKKSTKPYFLSFSFKMILCY